MTPTELIHEGLSLLPEESRKVITSRIAEKWLERIAQMKAWQPPWNKLAFIESVESLIKRNPQLYPTRAQTDILENIYKHLKRKNMSEIEKQVLEEMGLES